MRRFVALVSAALIAGAALSACGGGGSSKAEDPGSTSSGTNASGDSSSDDDFKQLIDDASKEKYKITYTSDGGDEQTYAQDGNGKTVFGDDNSQSFVSDDATIVCNKSSSDAWECTQSPVSLGAAANPFLGLLTLQKTYLSALGDRFGDTSDKTIAGRDAKCVSFSQKDILGGIGGAIAGAAGADLKGSATYCFDKDTGVTLEISGTDDSGKETSSLIVTKFEIPTDAEFTPPATPGTTPSFTIPSSITVPGGGTITIPSIPGQ